MASNSNSGKSADLSPCFPSSWKIPPRHHPQILTWMPLPPAALQPGTQWVQWIPVSFKSQVSTLRLYTTQPHHLFDPIRTTQLCSSHIGLCAVPQTSQSLSKLTYFSSFLEHAPPPQLFARLPPPPPSGTWSNSSSFTFALAIAVGRIMAPQRCSYPNPQSL